MLKLFFLFISLFSFRAFADPAPLTLEECYAIALQNSPELGESRAQQKLAKWQMTESLSGFLPKLNANGHYFFHQRFPEVNLDTGTTQITALPFINSERDAEISLQVPLFDGFRNIDTYEAAHKSSEAAELNNNWANFQLQQQIRLAFFSILSAQELARTADQNVRDLQEHRRIVQNQLRAGVTTRVAILRIDTQISNAEDDRLNANNEVAVRTQRLAELLGEDTEERPISGTLAAPNETTLRAIKNAVPPKVRPDIEALDLTTEAMADRHRADAKWWVPKISFVGAYDVVRADSNKLDYFALGLQANWAIFDGLASYSRSKESIASEEIAANQHQSKVLQERTDFQTYRLRYQYNLEKYDSTLEDIKRSEESVHLAQSALKVGAQTSTDVLDAEQDLFNTRAKKIQAQYDSLEALVQFELAVGRNIEP